MGNRIYTIPRMGRYSDIFVRVFKELGLNIIPPEQITSESNMHGVRNSAEMVCWSLKASLGSIIDTVKKHNVTDVIMYNSVGQCRYRHFGSLYQIALDNLDIPVEIHEVKRTSFVKDIARITGKSWLRIWLAVRKAVKEIGAYEALQEAIYSNGDIKILLIGEIYCLLEPKVNFDLRNKLLKYKVSTKLAVTLYDFINNESHLKDAISKKAEEYIGRETGGHGFHNIVHVLENLDSVDGIIYVMPLSCMPEMTVKPIIEKICRENNKPLLQIEIDDNSSELNIGTRLEAFVETIRRKKK